MNAFLRPNLFLCLALLLVYGTSTQAASPGPVLIQVDTRTVLHRMAGGFGASWHAIRRETPVDRQLMTKARFNAPQGSAYGGNPPLDHTAAWRDLEYHLAWLGLDWCRIELSQRMYQPAVDRFDWANDEMLTLFRILDLCQKHQVDVFLTQMWNEVDWNTHEGVHPLQSAPKSMDAFAHGLGELIQHLVKTRGYTCVRWLCINNEPGEDWGWWLGPGRKPLSITPGLKAVRAELDRRGLSIPLSAPDTSWVGIVKKAPFDFDPYIGAYDAHTYTELPPEYIPHYRAWNELTTRLNKPFFITEMGDFNHGWQGANTGPRDFPAQLAVATKVIHGLNHGVDAFNRWSFVNRGDLDGQFQLVRTWDIAAQRFLDRVSPEPAAYHGYGILTRFQAKHSDVLPTTAAAGASVLAATLRSPRGNITTLLLNPDAESTLVNLRFQGPNPPRNLFRYQVTETAVAQPSFNLAPVRVASSGDQPFVETLPGRSITALSTFNLPTASPGIMAD
jgi:hypothetical protein